MIRDLRPPPKGNRIVYDDTVTGLGIRVTAAGHKAFVLGYTVRGSGKQRRYTIGDFGDWTTKTARNRARELKAAIDQGGDPLADIEAEREAPTVGDLIERFQEEHLVTLRPGTRDDYVRMIRSHVLPHLGEKKKAADVVFDDITALHRKITRPGIRIALIVPSHCCRRHSRSRCIGAGARAILARASSAMLSTTASATLAVANWRA
jgi:hypothetical protein